MKSNSRASLVSKRRVIFRLAALGVCFQTISLAQTTFTGSWTEFIPAVLGPEEEVYEDDITWSNPTERPGYVYTGSHTVELDWGYNTYYHYRKILEEPREEIRYDSHWNSPSWSDDIPDALTDALIVDSRSGDSPESGTIMLPGINEDAAQAKSLVVKDAADTGAQAVRLEGGTLNLSPGSVFGESLVVGVSGEQSRSTQLVLKDATLTSSAFAYVGRDQFQGTSDQLYDAELSFDGASRWFHPGGSIQIGGGPRAKAKLDIGQGCMLAGSLLPGADPDPVVNVSNGGHLYFRQTSQVRLSELNINNGSKDYSGLDAIDGNLETGSLTIGSSAPGRGFLSGDSTLREVRVADGSLHLCGTASASQVTLNNGRLWVDYNVDGGVLLEILEEGMSSGTLLMVAENQGDVANLIVSGRTPAAAENTRLHVHGQAALGYHGTATTLIEAGAVLDVDNKVILGHADSAEAGRGDVTVKGGGSMLTAADAEIGYSYWDDYSYNPYPSPSGSLTLETGANARFKGSAVQNYRWDDASSSMVPVMMHQAGMVLVGKNGVLDLKGGRMVFTDTGEPGVEIPQFGYLAELRNNGMIRGGGSGADIDFGTIPGRLTNQGMIAPEGVLSMTGDLQLKNTGTLAFGIRGAHSHDKISAAGLLSPGGALVVTLEAGFTPSSGDSFDLLDAGSIAPDRTFSQVNLPALSAGLFWDQTELLTQGKLHVISPADPRDSDGDGLSNYEELHVVGTRSDLADSDGDGLWDGDELHVRLTDPLLGDTDADGYLDGLEIAKGSDPRSDLMFPHFSATCGAPDAEGQLALKFVSKVERSYSIEESDDLGTWNVVEQGVVGTGGEMTRILWVDPLLPRKWFRVRAD